MYCCFRGRTSVRNGQDRRRELEVAIPAGACFAAQVRPPGRLEGRLRSQGLHHAASARLAGGSPKPSLTGGPIRRQRALRPQLLCEGAQALDGAQSELEWRSTSTDGNVTRARFLLVSWRTGGCAHVRGAPLPHLRPEDTSRGHQSAGAQGQPWVGVTSINIVDDSTMGKSRASARPTARSRRFR